MKGVWQADTASCALRPQRKRSNESVLQSIRLHAQHKGTIVRILMKIAPLPIPMYAGHVASQRFFCKQAAFTVPWISVPEKCLAPGPAHTWRTALATARMTASWPTAASATAVTAGGIWISRRLGSTMRLGRSTVSSFDKKGCMSMKS